MTDEFDPLILSLMDAPITLRKEVEETLYQMSQTLLASESSAVLHIPMSLAHELGIVIQLGLSAIGGHGNDA